MGFDNECILNIETLAGEYFCPVCRTLVYPHEAIQTQCTHLYCKPCLTYVVGSTQACPYDGYLVTEAASKPLMESNKALAEAIGKTSVHCLYHRSGCVWQGPLSECTAHCAGCGFGNSPVVCNRCGVQIVHRQVQEHAQTCNNVNGTNSEALGGSETTAAQASIDQSKIANQASSAAPTTQPQLHMVTTAASSVPSNPVSQATPAPAPPPTTEQQWYPQQQQQQQQQQYYQQYPPYQQQQQQPYQQYYPPYQQQPQVVQSQPQMQQQVQAPILAQQPLQYQMQSQGQAQVPGPVPPPYPPQAAVVGQSQQAYSQAGQAQMQQYPPQQMMQYSQVAPPPQPHYPPAMNPPPIQPNNVYHPPVPPQPQPQPYQQHHRPPLPPQPQPQPPPHMRPMFPPQPQPPPQPPMHPHQQRPFIQQPIPPQQQQQQQPPSFPSFPQVQPPPQPPPPHGFVQPQAYMGRPPPPPMSQQFPTAIPPPHARPPPQFAPTQPSVTQPPPPHVVQQQQQYVSPLKGDEAVDRKEDASPSLVVKSETVLANNSLKEVKPENNEPKTTSGEEDEKVVSDSIITTQRVKEENKDADSPHKTTTENQQQEAVNNNNTSVVGVTTTEQGTSPYGFPGPNSDSDRIRGAYEPQSAAAAGQYNHSLGPPLPHEGPRHPMDMYPNHSSFPSTRPPLGGGYGYGPPRFHDGHGYHSHFGDDHRGRRLDNNPPPMHHDGFGRHHSPRRSFGERHSFGGPMMHHHNNNRGGGEFDGRHMGGFGESYGPFRGRGEAFGGGGGRPRLGEPGFRSSYSPQGFFTGGDSFDFDGGLSLSQRKRKTSSVGWCRICKIDCESVEGLEMHGQTRDHQRMAMDMVLSIKRNNNTNNKKLKPSNNHHSTRDDPRNAPDLHHHTIT